MARARKYCNCDVGYTGQDPEMLLTSLQLSLNKEYKEVKEYLENIDCAPSEYKEKAKLLEQLEKARQELDEKISNLDDEVTNRMYEAYVKYGSILDKSYQLEMENIKNDVELQLTAYVSKFRHQLDQCRAFPNKLKGSNSFLSVFWYDIL